MLSESEIALIKLNYEEFAFLKNISKSNSKQIFAHLLDRHFFKINSSQLISFSILALVDSKMYLQKKFNCFRRLQLLVEIIDLAKNYKKHLIDIKCINQKRFVGGKSIFYKILDNKKIKEAHNYFKNKHISMYN